MVGKYQKNEEQMAQESCGVDIIKKEDKLEKEQII